MQKVVLTPRTLRELGLYFSQVFPLVSLNYPPTMSPKAPYLGNRGQNVLFRLGRKILSMGTVLHVHIDGDAGAQGVHGG